MPGERTIICTSWLLDRELSKVLPDNSRIVGFAHMFFPLTPPGRETSLQRKILRHRSQGGCFRLTGGFLLPEILESREP